MSRSNNGGPAFPRAASEFTEMGTLRDGNQAVRAQAGMMLRDYFAAKVIGQCQITVEAGKDAPDDADVQATAARFARAAYVIADAMLAERSK